MDDVQSWPEVPSIAHFCSLFRAAFNLLDFDIEELEEALLTDGAEDAGSSLLQELIVRLLCGCIQNNDISTFNYQMFLRRLFRQKCQEYGRENPFNTDIDFQFLPLRVKVEILHALCDFRLDAADVPDLLRNLESDSLRVEPLGHDESKSAYWYFYGTRLYREDFPRLKKKIKERKKRRKEDKRKRRHSIDSDLELEERGAGVWQVVCFTEADWVSLASNLKGSSCKAERELYQTLVEDFLPEIPRLFAEKERLQRRRMMEYQPRRQSSRLEKLKQKESKDAMSTFDDDYDDDYEEAEHRQRKERRERFMNRSSRRSSRSGSMSAGSEGDEELEDDDMYDFDDGDKEVAPRKEGRPAGRQTNNSLSSATGQIIIQPPKKKKNKSKQVYKTSVEDLKTGMYKILEYVKSQEDAWPFLSPVDENYAPRYYSVIRRPMDLRRMEEKLDDGEYRDLNHFRDDFQLIVDNCRQYNGSENEYTEMVNNLLEAFNEAVDRYLETDPSSDEDLAVEFAPRVESSRHKEKKQKHEQKEAPKRTKSRRRRKAREKMESFSDSDSDLQPPSLKPQRDRSSMSDRSGSVPGSDFDDREPEFLRETSPPRLTKADSDSDSTSQTGRRSKSSKHRIRTDFNMDELVSVTEEMAKAINDLLEDMPYILSSADQDSSQLFPEEFPIEPRTHKPDRSFRNPREPARRRKPTDAMRPKRKDIRTIERLQPGKSKGNLIANMPKPKDHSEESNLVMGLAFARLSKENRNALLVKTDVTGPKLSLGTVLTSDMLNFGKSKHSFDSASVEEDDKNLIPDESSESTLVEYKSPVPTPQPVVSELTLEDKEEESIINKENDPIVEKTKDIVTAGPEEKKRDAVKEITNKAAPNASAWFKAFGAPKAPATVKKKQDAPEPPPVVEEKETPWGGSPNVAAPGGKRQRKASSSSSMSEPSSLSQDSPLHPVSPGLVSPRGEPPIPPVNGTLRVGFYQDMSSVHKTSPEKQSPRSTHSSPREISNPSPFQGYSHVYPPSSPGPYANYMAASATPPQPQPMSPHMQGPPTSLYEAISHYPPYSEALRQPVRTLENYTYKPPDPTPKSNPNIFPVKKRIFANVETTKPIDVDKNVVQNLHSDAMTNRIYNEPAECYPVDASYQQRALGQYGTNAQVRPSPDAEQLSNPRLGPQTDLSRLSLPSDMSRTMTHDESPRFHPDMIPMTVADNNSKYPTADRSLNAMIENLTRLPNQARGFPAPLDRRLMQPGINTIQEDSDGVFRNKFTDAAAFAAQRHQPPVSAAFPSSNLSHMPYDDERLLASYNYDKSMYLKNVPATSSLPMYQDNNPNLQTNYELNIPKPRETKTAKRKKGGKAESSGASGFQQYVGLKPTEPTVPPISLKTTAAVPGSAFNFGPGLSMYSEGYLEDLRQPAYYGMVGGDKSSFLAPPARSSTYPLPQYMGQPGLVDGYQQYLQRVQEEQLRHHGLYPPGYHAALGMRPTYDRSWP